MADYCHTSERASHWINCANGERKSEMGKIQIDPKEVEKGHYK